MVRFIVNGQAATLTVTNSNDSLAGSLRQAIQDAPAGSTIVFNIPTSDPGYDPTTRTFTVQLTQPSASDPTAALVIAKNLTIDGGGSRIVVKRTNGSAAPYYRVFSITTGTVTLARLTVSGGNAHGTLVGDAIRNAGTLTIDRCSIINNGGTSNGIGDLGAVANTGSLLVVNSTVAGNHSNENGAIYNAPGATLILKSCTVAQNSANSVPPGVQNDGTAHVGNCAIAGNIGGGYADAFGSFVSDGYNFIGRATGISNTSSDSSSGFGESGSHDQLGTFDAPADPKLGSLQDNGGPTETMEPLAGSPLIDQGNSFGLTTDQRGQHRPIDDAAIANAGDASDIGAFETDVLQVGPNFVVNTSDEHSDQFCGVQDCSLWDAANAADVSNNTTITFAPNVRGTITTALQADGIEIFRPVSIVGPGPRLLTISGAHAARVFHVLSSGVTISGLTIADGSINAQGGGILNEGGLALIDCAIHSNSVTSIGGPGGSTARGGAIFNNVGASLAATRCTFSANTAINNAGGAIDNESSAVLTNCTFAGNAAELGGAIFMDGSTSTLTLLNCTLTGNAASSRGGGIEVLHGTAGLGNTLLAKNGAGTSGTAGPDLFGMFISNGNNLVSRSDASSGLTDGAQGDKVGTSATPLDARLDPAGVKNNGGPTDTVALLSASPAIDAANPATAPATDQRGISRAGSPDIGAFEFSSASPSPSPTPSPTATPTPAHQATNISTRGVVGIGDEVMVGGFTITGSGNKSVLVRAKGPSLTTDFGLNGTLQDPVLSLFDSTQQRIAFNDNWSEAANAQSIDPAMRPGNPSESAILTSLPPGAYTAIVTGAGGGSGIGQVEIFDVDPTASSKLYNISTRGLVETGDNVMIGGFVVKGPDLQTVVVRAKGPSLSDFALSNVLQNPTLSIFNDQGARIQFNDDWQSDQRTEILGTNLQPGNDAESAVIEVLPAGNYTAIVHGSNETTGLALLEIFAVD